MQILLQGHDAPLVRLDGTVFAVDQDGVWVHEAVQPLEQGTRSDRQLAAALRQLVEAAEAVERESLPSEASLLGDDGKPVRTDHGMLYID
jgi:hypothetical protein